MIALQRVLPLLVLALTVVACGDDAATTTPPGPTIGELVVRASGSAVGSSGITADASVPDANVSASVSGNADCSAPYQTVFVRSAPTRLNIIGEPEIGRSDELAVGTYPCVLLRMSDFLSYTPTGTEGACQAGVAVAHDFFRAGNEPVPWRDPAGSELLPRGTREAPVEDLVWIYLSRNEAAVEARGYPDNQVLPLSSSLEVPGVTTFYWDLTDGLGDDDGRCEVVSGVVGFR